MINKLTWKVELNGKIYGDVIHFNEIDDVGTVVGVQINDTIKKYGERLIK